MNLRSIIRRLVRNKRFSLINIIGLAIGLAACLLIYLYVGYELGYDAYNKQAARIVRVTSIFHTPESDMHLAGTPVPLAPALLKDCPELESAVRIELAGNITIHRNGETIAAENFCYSEPAIFSIFSFKFLEGTPQGALDDPHSIVLSREAARTNLGAGPYLGKTLVCNGQPYRVTGVFQNQPANTDQPIEALLPKDFAADASWVNSDFDDETFVLFRTKPDLRRFNSRLTTLMSHYIQPGLDEQGLKAYHIFFESEKLTDVHFSQGKLGDNPKGNRQILTVFFLLAVFILLIALLNYVNLSTAGAIERAKEVAVRKVIGARPARLIREHLTESSLLIGIAWILAFSLALAGIPLFNRILDVHLTAPDLHNLWFIVLLFPVTTVLAGGYPAFVLSRYTPVRSLKGELPKAQGVGLRKVLTVTQLVIALAMMAGTVVIYQQMRFMAHQQPGMDRSGVTCITIPNDSTARATAPAFFQALRQETAIRDISIGSGVPTDGVQMASTQLWHDGKKRELMLNYFFIDPKLLPMLHISLAAGRNFSASLPTDKQESFIVNETLVRTMGWKNGIGETMEGGGVKGKVIGVVRDFYFKSLHNAIEPMVMIYKPDPPLAVLVRTSTGELSRLRQLWKTWFPTIPFNYYYLDEDFSRQYEKDRMIMTLFNVFAGLAVFICFIGLYGLVSLLTLRRTKELGIRKVLGATMAQLIALLGRELLWLVGVAALIAFPFAAIAANRWLASYAYHTGLSVELFAWPLAAILLLTMGVTGYRILRAASANPIKSLRSEG